MEIQVLIDARTLVAYHISGRQLEARSAQEVVIVATAAILTSELVKPAGYVCELADGRGDVDRDGALEARRPTP